MRFSRCASSDQRATGWSVHSRATARRDSTQPLVAIVQLAENLGVLLSLVPGLESGLGLLVVAALAAFAILFRRRSQTQRQRLFVKMALLLWLALPMAVITGALFAYSGPDSLAGIGFNPVAAAVTGFSFPLVALLGVTLIAIARGARLNVAALVIPLLPVQYLFGLGATCAVAGVCA